MRQTDFMAADWVTLKTLVKAATTVRQLLADESAMRMQEILGAIAEVHLETAKRGWVDASWLQGPEQASVLAAVANNLEVTYTAHTISLKQYKPWEWLPQDWEKTGKLQRLRQKVTDKVPVDFSQGRLEKLRESAEAASQLALFNGLIYHRLGNREPMVRDRVGRAEWCFKQYMAIQEELFKYHEGNYSLKDSSTSLHAPQFPDYSRKTSMVGGKYARLIYQATAVALPVFESITEALTGEAVSIQPLDTSRYPELGN